MKKIFATLIFWGIVSLGICQTGSNIYATNSQDDYSEQYFYGLELPYAKYKSQTTWVEVQYKTKNRTAVAQVLDDGPQNIWDAYWNSGTSRVMFQNFGTGYPAGEWILGSPRIVAHPNELGTSDFYINPLSRITPTPTVSFTPPASPQTYPTWTANQRYWGDWDPKPNNGANINVPSHWKPLENGAGIDFSGGVWLHLSLGMRFDPLPGQAL